MLIKELPNVSYTHAEHQNICNVRVYSHQRRVVVVVSEMLTSKRWYFNFGTAVSVAIRDVAAAVLAEVGRWDDLIIHTPARYAEKEDWALVDFSAGNPERKLMHHNARPNFRSHTFLRLYRSQVEHGFIGEKFLPVPTRQKR